MKMRTSTKIPLLAALVASGLLMAGSARANVYATSIKLNGTQTGVVNTSQGNSVSINYILNDNATAGVKISILSGTNIVRTISIASGAAGTLKGSNTVSWDGKDGNGANVAVGSYSVSVNAAHLGYSGWTQITSDSNTNNYIYRPRGIAVNKNITSPYYGRIFVGNTAAGPNAATHAWGDEAGIYKLNADGTPSTDGAGAFGTAGYFSNPNNVDGFDSPINLKVFEDDRVYWNNWINIGEFVAADMLLTTNQIVLGEGTYSANPYYPNMNLHHFTVTDAGTTNARFYIADQNFPSSGLWWYPMTNGYANTNDFPAGFQAIQTGSSVPLRCDGIDIDVHTNIYVSQTRGGAGNQDQRAYCFTNWDGQTTIYDQPAAWAVGAGDDGFRNVYDVALDSVQNPHYIAYSMAPSIAPVSYGIRLLNAADGSIALSNIDNTIGYHSCNWDAVGNLYGGADASRWRAWSPPGANNATTPALATLQIAPGVTAPHITSISNNGTVVTINFTADAADAASAFTLQGSSTVNGTYASTGATAVANGGGSFTFSTAASGSTEFYRISR
jgi:hypothetical protein